MIVNGYQIATLLSLAWPDKGNPQEPEQGETEIVLVHNQHPQQDPEGVPMPAGLYMYYVDCPEEGMIFIPPTPNTEPVWSQPKSFIEKYRVKLITLLTVVSTTAFFTGVFYGL